MQGQREKRPKENSSEDIAGLLPISAEVDDKIRKLDELITEYASMLDLIQPSAPGKIGVRFMALYGGALQEPVFIVWKYTAATRKTRELKYYDIVPANEILKRVKRYGPFMAAASDVRFLLHGVREMIQRRKQLTNIAARFRQSISLSLSAAGRAYGDHLTSYHVEHTGLVDRHHYRLTEWKLEQQEKARADAELEAMGAIPDPDDYIDLFVLPPDPFDEEEGALPDEYLDEDGNYVGP